MHRRDTLRASKIMQDKAFANPKIDVRVEQRGRRRARRRRRARSPAIVLRDIDDRRARASCRSTACSSPSATRRTPRCSRASSSMDANGYIVTHDGTQHQRARRVRVRRRAGSRLPAGDHRRRLRLHGGDRRRALPRRRCRRASDCSRRQCRSRLTSRSCYARTRHRSRLARRVSSVNPPAADHDVAVVEHDRLAGRDRRPAASSNVDAAPRRRRRSRPWPAAAWWRWRICAVTRARPPAARPAIQFTPRRGQRARARAPLSGRRPPSARPASMPTT